VAVWIGKAVTYDLLESEFVKLVDKLVAFVEVLGDWKARVIADCRVAEEVVPHNIMISFFCCFSGMSS
jgi:hypothetical protein